MRSLIITVAGTSTRFNRDTKEDVLKCLYHIGDPHLSLLYQQVYKAYGSVDEIIIVGGYKFDSLVKFVNEELAEFKPKIKLVFNEHYLDYGSGYSLLNGIDAVSSQADETIFIEGDLFFDQNSLTEIINSDKDVISINNESIKANKAVALYFDANLFPHYLYDTSHSCLSIGEPFTAIYNSGQMWKFVDVKRLREIRMSLTPEQVKGTNLVIIQLYFGKLKEQSITIVPVKDWFNCNTVADYLAAYKQLTK